MQVAVRQSGVHLRQHEPGIYVKLLRELPVDCKRYGVESSAAVRRCWPDGAVGRRAEGWLEIVIISADYIHFLRDGVFRSRPENVQRLVAGVECRVHDICVVEIRTADAKNVSGNAREEALRIARRRVPYPLVAGVH